MAAVSGIRDLQDTEFYRIKEVVHKECGIYLSDMKKALVQSRVMKRLRDLKLWNFKDYCEYLEEHYETEIVNLINAITTNKTDFFREPRHFQFMRHTALPELERSGKRKVRIWSAGCSIGAEPYTIAIIVMEHFRGRTAPEIKILATDIDTQVLRKAESGIYSSAEVEKMDDEILKRYFMRGVGENDGLFKVKDPLKRIVTFRRLNLLDEQYPMRGPFDIIFCRNVIIYFDGESRRKLYEKFHSYLGAEGYLIMGHSETLSGLSDRFSFIGNTIYRKVV